MKVGDEIPSYFESLRHQLLLQNYNFRKLHEMMASATVGRPIYAVRKVLYIYGGFYGKFLYLTEIFCFEWNSGISGKFPYYPYSLTVNKGNKTHKTEMFVSN